MALDTTIGGATADSYVTLAEYQARAAAFGWVLDASATVNEVNLRKARLSNDMTKAYIGYRVSQSQALEFPRFYDGLVNGYPMPIDAIPQAVKNAQMDMAYLIQGGADPLASIEGVIAKESAKAGPVEVSTEYVGGKAGVAFVGVDAALRPYLASGAGQRALVRA